MPFQFYFNWNFRLELSLAKIQKLEKKERQKAKKIERMSKNNNPEETYVKDSEEDVDDYITNPISTIATSNKFDAFNNNKIEDKCELWSHWDWGDKIAKSC